MPPEGKRCCVFAGGQLPPVVPLHLGTPTPPRHWQCADDIPICYLCGAPKPNRWNRDHVPPRQFFPKSLLKTGEVDALEWLPTHHECNSAYQLDEEYFVVALGIMARTMAGHTLMHDVLDRLEKGQQTALVKKVEAEFIDKTTKRIERHRVNRVATKMVRGLHFLRTGSFVPASTQFFGDVDLLHRDNIKDLDTTLDLMGLPSPDEGTFPQVFKMKALMTESRRHTYILVLWETVVCTLSFYEE